MHKTIIQRSGAESKKIIFKRILKEALYFCRLKSFDAEMLGFYDLRHMQLHFLRFSHMM